MPEPATDQTIRSDSQADMTSDKEADADHAAAQLGHGSKEITKKGRKRQASGRT